MNIRREKTKHPMRTKGGDQVAFISFNLLLAFCLCLLVALSYVQRQQQKAAGRRQAASLVSSSQSWQEDNGSARGI
jgi:hypothetical protein